MKHKRFVSGAMFSWDGQRVLSWGQDGTPRLGSVTNDALIALFPHGPANTGARFDPLEQCMLTTGENDALQLWDISFDPKIPLEERILEFEVRNATTLANNGAVLVLSEVELADKATGPRQSAFPAKTEAIAVFLLPSENSSIEK